MVITEIHSLKAKLTGTGNNWNVAQQGEDLWAEEGAVPNCEELVEKRLWTGEPSLMEQCDKLLWNPNLF